VQKEQAVASQNSVIAAKEQTIEQQNQAVIAAQARLAAAKVALNPSNAEVKGYRQRVAEETARGKALITTLKKERYGLLQQQIRTMQQLDNGEKELRQVELLLRQTLIAAPTDGILFNLNLRNAGQMVRASEEIAKIAPSHTPLVVKAQVAAADIGKVKLTQQVQVRVSACPYPDYGTLKGQVRAIAPDAISPANISPTSGQKPGESENRFYEVVIEPESRRLAQAGKTCDIQLGMAGKADIITKEETLMQFLFRKARLITDL
jgi:multidrug efflux pump subunit AcrA (membrane-fusion protein)